jgi:GDP-L-fucose synthase
MLLPVNLYGPRDNFDPESSHVIPAMIRKFVEAKARGERTVGLWGNGTPTREFLYVEDAARGVVEAALHYNDPEPVNLGAGFEISMRDLANKIATLVGFEGEIAWDPTRPNGQPRRMLDVSRARERFGFTSRVSFDDGLAKAIAWFNAHRANIR